MPLLALHLPKSRTEAIMCVTKIVTYGTNQLEGKCVLCVCVCKKMCLHTMLVCVRAAACNCVSLSCTLAKHTVTYRHCYQTTTGSELGGITHIITLENWHNEKMFHR